VFDNKLGEAITLLYEGLPSSESEIREFCKENLEKYEIPRYYINVSKLPFTASGKPSREKAKNLANELIKKH
jgi:fatty-acyl-CoA synthase